MGARDDFTPPRRGLPQDAAMAYLGVKRRTFERLKESLRPVRLGTSLVYDIRDLDILFDKLKAESAAAPLEPKLERACSNTTVSLAVSLSPDRRPAPKKGDDKWVVKAASTKTQKEDGELTESTAVSAFKVVSALMKRQSVG